MAFDSLDIFAACALFCACVGAWQMAVSLRAPARLYLRFAAMLFAALGAARLCGLAGTAALLLLPLAATSLMVAALALFARPLPAFAASVVLVAALASGLAALLSGAAMLALVPALVASLAIIAAALNGVAAIPLLAGASLLAGGLAFLEQGAQAGMLLLCGAALVGLAKPTANQRRSALAVEQQRRARTGNTAIGRLH